MNKTLNFNIFKTFLQLILFRILTQLLSEEFLTMSNLKCQIKKQDIYYGIIIYLKQYLFSRRVMHEELPQGVAKDAALAEAIAAAVRDFDPTLVLVGLAGGKLIEAGRAAGLATAQEFFADRNYMADGTLVPRKQENAVIADEDFAVARVVRAVQEGTIEAVDGSTIEVAADTICIHGDNAHALEFAKKIREALMQADVELKPSYG